MGRRGERKIAPFRFVIEGSVIEVPVWWMDKSPPDYAWDYSKGHLPKTYFRARYDPSDLDIWDTDIERLRAKAEETVQAWYKVEWSPFIRVIVGSYSDYEGTHVTFEYEFYAIGNRPDGKTVYRKIPEPEDRDKQGFGEGKWSGKWDQEFMRYASDSIHEGLPETGKTGQQYGSRDSAAALVPCTPENMVAVKRFEKALEALADEMRKRFMPDRIERTMEFLLEGARIPILPAKKEEEDGV